MNLVGLDMLLIWEATGEEIEQFTGETMSTELSSDCLINFSFFPTCWPYKPSLRHGGVRIQEECKTTSTDKS